MMTWVLRLLWVASLIAAPAVAQDGDPQARPIYNRDQWLPQSVPTSDDVLRIPVPADYNAPKGSFVLVGGRLFDGTGAPARPATIVVQGKTITAVLKPGERNWPADAVIYDVTGKTVMPGLIDLHTHLTFLDVEDFDLYSTGNTSGAESVMRGVRRMAHPSAIRRHQRARRGIARRCALRAQAIAGRGRDPGAAHLHGRPADHPDRRPRRVACDRPGLSRSRPTAIPIRWSASPPVPTHGARRCASSSAKGADLIKLASEYTQEEITAAVDEAHSLGLPVTVDAETQYIDMAIKAGVDSIEHPLPRSDAAVALMAKRGIASVPTLVPYRIIQRVERRLFRLHLAPLRAQRRPRSRRWRRRCAGPACKMGIGLDLITDWPDYMPGAYIDELESFIEIGFTKTEALVAATKTSAEIMRMGDRLGTIEAGKLADIIVVDGNPDEDFNALRKVRTAFVNGRLMLQDGRIYKPAHEEVPLPARQPTTDNTC